MKLRLLLLVLASSGCEELGCAGPAKAPRAVAPQPFEARSLALADPGGRSAIDEEIRAAQARVKQVPKSDDRLIELGRAWVLKARHEAHPGWYQQAKACADVVLQRDPKNRLAKELTAQVLLSQHRFAEAKELCEQVLAVDPEAPITLGTYSDALFELGRVDEAITAADQMVTVKPNTASYVRVSYFQWLKGDLPAALESARLAINAGSDPTQPEPKAYALAQTAGFFFLGGDYEGADHGYQQALEHFPGYVPALVGRGRARLALGDTGQAAQLLQAANRAAPLAETAWRLGDALLALGDERGARAAFAEVVDLGRRSDARTLAAFYAVRNRDVPEALQLIEAEMKTRPGLYTQATYAWVLYRAGRLVEARQHIASATRLGTRDPVLRYWEGAISIASGDPEAGVKRVNEALSQSPAFDPTGAPEARKLVEQSSAPLER